MIFNTKMNLTGLVKTLSALKYFLNVCIIPTTNFTMIPFCYRIYVAKPHNADVKRLISVNNLLKSLLRSTI